MPDVKVTDQFQHNRMRSISIVIWEGLRKLKFLSGDRGKCGSTAPMRPGNQAGNRKHINLEQSYYFSDQPVRILPEIVYTASRDIWCRYVGDMGATESGPRNPYLQGFH